MPEFKHYNVSIFINDSSFNDEKLTVLFRVCIPTSPDNISATHSVNIIISRDTEESIISSIFGYFSARPWINLNTDQLDESENPVKMCDLIKLSVDDLVNYLVENNWTTDGPLIKFAGKDH